MHPLWRDQAWNPNITWSSYEFFNCIHFLQALYWSVWFSTILSLFMVYLQLMSECMRDSNDIDGSYTRKITSRRVSNFYYHCLTLIQDFWHSKQLAKCTKLPLWWLDFKEYYYITSQTSNKHCGFLCHNLESSVFLRIPSCNCIPGVSTIHRNLVIM